ncbi:MAG: C4-dicarboxylate ABC transporter [Rubrivivax sp.]
MPAPPPVPDTPPASSLPPAAPRLQFLSPAWYAIVMGLAGLALAWLRAQPLLGAPAVGVALALGVLAAAAFAVLALASALRLRRHPEAWAADLKHPVRHAFTAAIPVSIILLATVAVAADWRAAPVAWLWWIGSLGQWLVTWWTLARWWRGSAAGGLAWPVLTPVLIIPVVGNVLAPLAGVPLGYGAWSAAQFGAGLLLWPVVLALLMVRIATQGLWPERMLPSSFILIAPPAVVGLALLQFGAPELLAWMFWGMALFALSWAGALARRLQALPFGLPHWGMSFPLAALAALTLRLAGGAGGAFGTLALGLLALASVVIAALALGTWRGLRDGTLLAPEPVAVLQPAGR